MDNSLYRTSPIEGGRLLPVNEPLVEPAPVVVPPLEPHRSRPCVDGKFLQVAGRRFRVKGVTYGTFSPNDQGEPYPPFPQLRDDFHRMAESGINTVRLYTPPSDRIADAAANAGLMLIPDICWGPRFCELHRPDDLNAIYGWTRRHARRLAGHPAILMLSIGNEIPPLLVRWYGRQRIQHFLRQLSEIVRTEDPEALVTYACHPPTEHLHLPFIDVVSFNVYLEREPEFRRYLERLQILAGDRPLLISELGLDSSAHGEHAQASALRWQLRAVFEKGLCGATVYSWTDEWSIFSESVSGWSFGLTCPQRRPKASLGAVRTLFRSELHDLRPRQWPRVSVVVACCNGAATLDECLRGLCRLNYPDYEVIVIDDGSRDDSARIAARHPVRCISVENGGLSRARNLGIASATGEIVAFIDSDAWPDPEWLTFLVTELEEQNAAAVGGPNLSPPQDGFVAQCVDQAPGNPTHVLIDNHLAEHVPGCNMAFRKSAIREIGCFDPVHRAAGDDVDVCWKLLARGQKIAFSPAAVVWHHRRGTIRGYLRQQRGYGFAEAHLRRRYPGHFNIFGYAVWSGGVYDGIHRQLRLEGLPRIFRPRIYYGQFGSAQFQSIYQPFQTWWFQVFTSAEWQALTLCVAAAGILAVPHSFAGACTLLAIGLAMILALTTAALAAGLHAASAKQWRGSMARRGVCTVALLHIAQPLARAAGRIRGAWRLCREKSLWPPEGLVWGNVEQRDRWLHCLCASARRNGWVCAAGCDWSDHDLEISGPGPWRLRLISVAEERLEKGWFHVRYRIRASIKPTAVALTALLLALLALLVSHAWLLPLAAPVLVLLWVLLRARATMTAALSQLATECAEAMNMPKVEEHA